MEKRNGLLRNTFVLLKHYRDSEYFKEYLLQMLTQLGGFMKNSASRNLIQAMLVYITETTDITTEEFTQIVEKVPTAINTETMTLYQNILNSGIEQGIEKGQELKNEIVVRNAVAKGFDDQTIAELTGLSVKEVIEIIEKLGLR